MSFHPPLPLPFLPVSLPLPLPLLVHTALTSVGAGPDMLSRAMVIGRISSRTRVQVERRVACMSKWRLRSSSSMPLWTPVIFTRSDRTSPHVRSYRRTLTSKSSSDPRTSPLKVCASTSCGGRQLVLCHMLAPAQQAFAVTSVFQQAAVLEPSRSKTSM